MVKKFVILSLMLIAIILLSYPPKPVNASSFNELIIGTSPDDVGEYITSSGGFKMIEFWHYSGGYWKATTVTNSGLKEIIISDSEAKDGIWARPKHLEKKIYENNFVLEYKISHPPEVLAALISGAKITPVLSIDAGTLCYSDEYTIPIRFFNFEPLPMGLASELPENPKYALFDSYIQIRALPKLNFQDLLFNEAVPFYPHRIPLVQPGFGSLSYAMYHHDGSYAGVGYSPDPFYKDMYTIPYIKIQDIQGRLAPGFPVTTATNPERRDEESGELRIGYNTFQNAGAVCIRFWYPIRIDYYAKGTDETTPTPTPTSSTTTPTPSPIPEPEGESITEDLQDENISSHETLSNCVVKADERGNEQFDVSLGIPVRENLYVNVVAKEYLYNYGFTEHTYTGSETIRVKKTYNLKWEEDEGTSETEHCGTGTMYHIAGTFCADADGDGINDSCPGHPYSGCKDTDGDYISDYCPGHDVWTSNWVEKTDTQTVYSDPHTVNRSYSYRTINNLEVFVPESVKVQNAALPGGNVSIAASGLPIPVISLSHSDDLSEHVLSDPFQLAKDNDKIKYDSVNGFYVIELESETLNGGTSKPDVPAITDYISKTENAISSYHVKNDSLVFNGSIILDNTISETGTAKAPESIPEAWLCNNNVFYKNQLLIPVQVLNGTHESSGSITYKRLTGAVNPTSNETIEQELPPINSVKVHTPVVCNSGVYDEVFMDQSLIPDENRAAVILGRPSKIQFLAKGEHLDIPGFNAPAVHADPNNPNKKEMDCSKYTKDMQVKFPFDVYIGTDKPDNAYFLPKNTWYSVHEQGITDLYIPTWIPEGEYDVDFREIAINAPDITKTQHLANKDITNYVATRSSKVRVIGRLYGFKITDVSDTLWYDVFRVSKTTSAHTGNYYYVGTKDENRKNRGISSLFTLPLLEGSHAKYKNRGALKTGYTFRFNLETIGGYFGDDDHIQITPTFYYVKKDGTGRQEVDLHYHAEFNGKVNYYVALVPEGRNRDNPLFMELGNRFRNVPEKEIKDTARLLGIDNIDSFKYKKDNIGWFDKIILSKYQRTFIGAQEGLPHGVDVDASAISVQKWYGEYRLPNDLFVTTPGFNVPEYGRTHNGLSLGGKEDFWLKNGYIIVNFRIEAIKNNNFDAPSLSYWGAPRCNMFTIEGFQKEKTDYYEKEFILMDGDIVFYDTDERSTDDYEMGGTH